MKDSQAHDLIATSKLFRNMRPYETEAILERLQPSSYPKGACILERDVWHGRLYIVASGQVSVLLQEGGEVEEGKPRPAYIVARLGPGECFGEMSLITGELPGATVRAEQDTLLWSLTQADFLTLIGTCPTLQRNINTILSQRLARVNRHLISQQAAEVILLDVVDASNRLPGQALVYHIADRLAARMRRRVLVLELCERDAALCPHFAIYSDQLRPGLLACAHDHAQLQVHHAPTLTADGGYFPALAYLTETREQVAAVDAGLHAVLIDLALLYDYILLIATPRTPSHIRELLVEQQGVEEPYNMKRTLALLPADLTACVTEFLPVERKIDALFITRVTGRPTMGLQEQYAKQIERPVTRLLPDDEALLEDGWRQQKALHQLVPEAALSRGVDFVARYIAHQTVGIAFGGGGARGFAHLGVLQGLLTYNVPLDYIAACSIGVVTPGMYLLGKSLAESEEIFLEVQRHIVRWSFPRTSLFSNRGIKQMLRNLCGDLRFEDLETPFAMVAADLTTRAGVVLDHGPIWQAALASVALPGIFPPVMLGEHVLIDAGMHDPVPIRLVRRMGADILLASELGEQEPPSLVDATPWLDEVERGPVLRQNSTPGIVDLLLRSYELAMATIGMHSIREADVVIRPKLHRVSLRNFSEGRKFVIAGREAIEQMLPVLRKRLPWL